MYLIIVYVLKDKKGAFTFVVLDKHNCFSVVRFKLKLIDYVYHTFVIIFNLLNVQIV